MLIRYGRKFSKYYDKAPLKIRKTFIKRREIFQKDPFHPQLNNHQLLGNYEGFRSINVTGDWRAIFFEDVDEHGKKVVIFKVLGTHSQLYR